MSENPPTTSWGWGSLFGITDFGLFLTSTETYAAVEAKGISKYDLHRDFSAVRAQTTI